MTPETPRKQSVYKPAQTLHLRLPGAAKAVTIALISWAIALGCTTAPPPPPETPAAEVKVPVAETTTQPAPPEPPRAKETIDVELPASPACTVSGDWHARKADVGIFPTADRPRFAEILGGAATLHFPAGPRPTMQGLELAADGLVVRGLVDTTASLLLPSAPLSLSGLAIAGPYALLAWTEATPGHVTVTTEAPKELEVLSPPLVGTAACSEIALARSQKSFEPTDAIPGFSKAKDRLLPTDRAVDVALAAGGPAVARAHADTYTEKVSLLEAKGAHAKIAWRVGALVVVGWVKTSDLRIPKNGLGYGTGHGRLGPSRHTPTGKEVVCAADVDLLVEYPGEVTYRVGLIRRGTTIEVTSTGERFTMVSVFSEKIRQVSTAWWVVRTRDLEGCQSPSK